MVELKNPYVVNKTRLLTGFILAPLIPSSIFFLISSLMPPRGSLDLKSLMFFMAIVYFLELLAGVPFYFIHLKNSVNKFLDCIIGGVFIIILPWSFFVLILLTLGMSKGMLAVIFSTGVVLGYMTGLLFWLIIYKKYNFIQK